MSLVNSFPGQQLVIKPISYYVACFRSQIKLKPRPDWSPLWGLIPNPPPLPHPQDPLSPNHRITPWLSVSVLSVLFSIVMGFCLTYTCSCKTAQFIKKNSNYFLFDFSNSFSLFLAADIASPHSLGAGSYCTENKN